MKKFFAIVLGLALVLGLASVASAEFAGTGKIEVKTFVNEADGLDFLGLSYYELNLKLSNTWGAASGDATLRIKADALADPVIAFNAPKVYVNTANFNYKFSDAFTAGWLYSDGKQKIYSANVFDGDIKAMTQNLLKAKVTFDGGSVTGYTDLGDDMKFYGAADYAFEPITIKGYFGSIGTLWAVVEADYALSDEITLTGGFKYDEADAMYVGAKGVYTTDVLNVEAKFAYNLDDSAIDYYDVLGEFNLTEKLMVYGEYSDGDGLLAGAEYTFGTDTTLGAEYVVDDAELTVKLVLTF